MKQSHIRDVPLPSPSLESIPYAREIVRQMLDELLAVMDRDVPLPSPSLESISYAREIVRQMLDELLAVVDKDSPTFNDAWRIVMNKFEILSKLDNDGYVSDDVEF